MLILLNFHRYVYSHLTVRPYKASKAFPGHLRHTLDYIGLHIWLNGWVQIMEISKLNVAAVNQNGSSKNTVRLDFIVPNHMLLFAMAAY